MGIQNPEILTTSLTKGYRVVKSTGLKESHRQLLHAKVTAKLIEKLNLTVIFTLDITLTLTFDEETGR
ncbi:hypothetical protein B5X24_HaOG207149 [Helicoverpa armigera]|uniref:Uncharacterized protein n=1 Tax=Helicoverpa armigera TaxID=29058 RepID=A0A2W1BPK5_HELAM|nr:hypothetical protein B5X24_HaOG207149 [Helicoverpa armigera]